MRPSPATVAGGAGSNAKAVLATRMQANDPPDSFQVHAGRKAQVGPFLFVAEHPGMGGAALEPDVKNVIDLEPVFRIGHGFLPVYSSVFRNMYNRKSTDSTGYVLIAQVASLYYYGI